MFRQYIGSSTCLVDLVDYAPPRDLGSCIQNSPEELGVRVLREAGPHMDDRGL